MRFSQIFASCLVVLLLGACAPRPDGQPAYVGMELPEVKFPTGYYGQATRAGMELPDPTEEAEVTPPPETDLAQNEIIGRPARIRLPLRKSGDIAWDTLDSYDARNPQLPGTGLPPCPPDHKPSAHSEVRYNENVKVYPLDDLDAAPSDMPCETNPATAPSAAAMGGAPMAVPAGVYGEMVEQLFFDHGSSRIGKIDRKSLKELAASLATTGGTYDLTVIGHASQRVDGVTDPLRKKMINFEMALKRATAVAAELRKAGVKHGWVKSMSKGDEAPNPAPGDKDQESADRRVEVYMDNK